jgi:hypothetical protein
MLIREILREDVSVPVDMANEMMNLITTYRFRKQSKIPTKVAIDYLGKLGYHVDVSGLMDLLSAPPFKQPDGTSVVVQTTKEEIKLRASIPDSSDSPDQIEKSRDRVEKVATKAAVKAVKSGDI